MSTTAAHSDILPRLSACAGDIVECAVRPYDGRVFGPAVVDQLVIPGVPVPADLDGDGLITVDDMVIALTCFTAPDAGIGPCCRPADEEGDGDVDLGDLALLQPHLQPQRSFSAPRRVDP